VCYKLRFMLIQGNPRAEQNEPSMGSTRFGIGRDETEHRPTLLGRTEIETEHPLAPRDRTEISNLYPETSPTISVRSVRSQACFQLEVTNLLRIIIWVWSSLSYHGPMRHGPENSSNSEEGKKNPSNAAFLMHVQPILWTHG